MLPEIPNDFIIDKVLKLNPEATREQLEKIAAEPAGPGPMGVIMALENAGFRTE